MNHVVVIGRPRPSYEMNSLLLFRIIFLVIAAIFVLNFMILLFYFPLHSSSSSSSSSLSITSLSSSPWKKKDRGSLSTSQNKNARKKLRQSQQLPPLEVDFEREHQGQQGPKRRTKETTTQATTVTANAKKKTHTMKEKTCQVYGCPIYPPELTIPRTNQSILEALEASGYVESSPLSKANQRRSDLQFEFASDSFATLSQQGKSHSVNQDRAVFVSPFLSDLFSSISLSKAPTKSFLACIFDGHGRLGHEVAQEVVDRFPQLLSKKLTLALRDNNVHSIGNKNDVNINSNNSTSNTNQTILVNFENYDRTDLAIREALNETFLEVNEKGTPSAFLFGGCTATVTLRLGSRLYIANTGDSETIVVSASPAAKQHKFQKQVQTKQHNSLVTNVQYETRRDKANQPGERSRIEKLGGRIHVNKQGFDPRVIVYSKAAKETIGLAMSRSIGDWEWKEVGVTAEPTIDVIDLESLSGPDKTVFLLAASDGLWERRKKHFYANQMAASFVKNSEDERNLRGKDDDSDARFRPLYYLFDIIQRITPKLQTGYRDDITATIVSLG